MNLATKTMKRLGALLLVFAMVVGMLPVQAFAAEGDTVPFSFRLVRTKAEAPNGQYTYTYTVVPTGNTSFPTGASVEYHWDHDYTNNESEDTAFKDSTTDEQKHSNTYSYTASASRSVAVKVVVDGLSLTAVCGAGADQSEEAVWRAGVTMPAKIYAGVPFELPHAVPRRSTEDKNLGSGAPDAVIKTVYYIDGEKHEAKETVTLTEDTTISYEVYAGKTVTANEDGYPALRNSGVAVVNTEERNFEVSYAVGGKRVYPQNGEVWVTDAADISVRVLYNDTTLTEELMQNSYPLEGGSNWAKQSIVTGANGATTDYFVSTISWNNSDTSKTVSYNNDSVTFKVDNAAPTITDPVGYVSGNDIVLKFRYTVGESGLNKIELNTVGEVYPSPKENITVTVVNVENANNTYDATISYAKDTSTSATVRVYNNAVQTSDANPNNASETITIHKDALAYEISYGSDVTRFGNYVNNNTSVTVTVTGLSDTVSATATNNSFQTEYLTSTRNTLNFASVENFNAAQPITIKDTLGRQVIISEKLRIDKVPPVVTVTGIPENTSVAANSTTVAVTATDAGVGLNESQNLSAKFIIDKNGTPETKEVNFTYDSSTKTRSASYTVGNGEKLTSIIVSDVKDALGNETDFSKNYNFSVDSEGPAVVVTFSPNVKQIQRINGQIYLILDPVTDAGTGESETVTMTVNVNDPNMASNAQTEYTFSASIGKNTTSAVAYKFTAVDALGNKTNTVKFSVADANGMETYQDVTGTNGVFDSIVAIDRRVPSQSADAIAITPTTTSVAKAQVKHASSTESNPKIVPLYQGATLTYEVNVGDYGVHASGLNSVGFSVEGAGLTCSPTQATLNGNGTYTVTINANGNETNAGVLNVSVSDNAGNNIRYSTYFALDNKDPVITIKDESGADLTSETQEKYYQSQKVTVTVTDMFLSEAKYGNEELNVTDGKATREIILTGETVVSGISVTATDMAGNNSSAQNKCNLTVDNLPPEIELNIENDDSIKNGHASQALDYVFTISDANLDKVTVSYKITGRNAEEKNNVPVTLDNGTYKISVGNGQKLESCVITATDLANNEATRTLDDSESYLVDTEKPKVYVTRTGVGITTHDGQEIYYTLGGDGKVTYTIKIVDDTITLANSPILSITVKSAVPAAVPQGIIWDTLSEENGGPGVTTSFSLEDGQMLESLSFQVTDAAGNNAETAVDNFTVTNGRYALTKKEIVDNTAPRAEIIYEQVGTTDAKLAGFEFKGTDGNYVNYLKLSTDNADGEIDAESVTIKATLTLIDANLVSPGGGWTVSYTNPNVGTNSATYTKTVTVYKTIDATLNHYDIVNCDLEFSATDKAGNKLTKDTVTIEPIEQIVPKKNQTGDTVKIPLIVDFRKPTTADADAPTIEIGLNRNSTGTNGTLNLFSATNGALANNNLLMTFSAIISDKMASSILNNGTDNSSGMAQVKYALTGDSTKVNNKSDTITAQNGGMVSLSIPVELVSKNVETNDMSLSVQAFDIAGNGINKSINFGVDTMAPRVSVSYNNVPGYTVGSATYFAGTREATIQVEDINSDLSETGTTVTTEGNKLGWTDEKTQKVVFDGVEGGIKTYNLSVSSKDLAGNVTADENVNYGNHLAPRSFIIDKAAPVVEVTKTINDGGTFYTGTNSSVDYHNKTVTYAFTVSDNYLSNELAGNGQVQKVNISYTIEGGNAQGTKNITLGENGGLTYNNRANGKDEYSFTFTVKDGETLTDLSIAVMDNAGNVGNITTNGITLENGVFNGNDVCVDTTAPKIMLTRNVDPYQSNVTVDDVKHDFYNQAVTFTVTVEDANLVESNGSANALTAIEGITVADEWTHSGNRMTRQITVENTKMLSEITATIKDSAGNPAVLETFSDVTDISENVSFKDKGNGVYKYEGNRVVVDTDAPTAVLTMATVNDEMVGFYTDSKGIVYIKLNNPTKDGTPDNTVTVTLNFEVTDRNLGIGNGLTAAIGSWASNGEGWTGDYLINKTTGTAVHTQKVDVKTNGKGKIELDLNIADLAGNKLNAVTVTDIKDTVPGPNFIKVNEGHVTGTISLDRRQITSGNDTAAPYVELTPSTAAPSATVNGLELFNKSFTFGLKVNDGPDDGYNSGLKPVGQEGMGKISWTLTNEGNGNFVTTGDGRDITLDDTHKFEETIHINAGSGECNTFKLTVTAVDNVGNTIIYVRNFAVDTLAPRITVEFDNNDVRNDRYFRAERTATIMVEELNFDAAKTEIDSEIKNGAWGTDAQGRHVTTIDYNTDGDYTLHVSSTDLAGNHTPDGSVNYIGVACQAFTIDLTLPIIEVFYDPDIVSGVDEDGVDYYNADQHIGVRIIEHNFSENDVVDEFYINRDQPLGRGLGEFSDNGDNHNAAIVLENGNRYFFRVNYTDLAGNVADGYTSNFFSVDTVPPTIRTISELDNEQMNVVSGDLELQFVVEDAQDNLDTVHVVITHTNNSFETVMVSGPEFLTITPQKDRSTVTVNIANIQKLKNLDGIYTIELRAYDYAGNIVTLTPPMVISLNRFGSTFTTDDPFTKQFLTPGSDGVVYHNSVNGNLIIQEINPNRVFHDETLKEEGSVLTIVVNGRSIRLEEGEDYTMTVEKRGQEGSYWYCYTYEIDKKVFEEDGELRDGRYSILIYGVDEAGNNNTNESSEYSTLQLDGEGKYTGKIEFTIDTQAPVIITTGIESNEIYNEEFRQMQIEIADATPTSIQVYLNEELVGLSIDAANLPENTLWLTQDKETGIYTLNVNEQSGIFNSQNVRIVATDAAANAAEAEVNDFHISTSFLVRMLNSIWFYLILVAVAAGVVVLVVFSRKKKAAV